MLNALMLYMGISSCRLFHHKLGWTARECTSVACHSQLTQIHRIYVAQQWHLTGVEEDLYSVGFVVVSGLPHNIPTYLSRRKASDGSKVQIFASKLQLRMTVI